jgi:3-isopropylmalate dehydrogenase
VTPPHRIAILPGDGIGPETVAEAVRVLEAAASAFDIAYELVELPFGGAAIDAAGEPLPAGTRAGVLAADAVLKGAIGGPQWDGARVRPEEGLLRLRAELRVFANVRPIRRWTTRTSSPLRPELAEGIDLVFVRELTGGLYFGARELTDDRAFDTCIYTRAEVERVAHRAFALARERRGVLCSVDKANVLDSSRLWRRVVTEVAADYPDVELSHQLVDSMAMKLVEQPAAYDVVVTENMFGDILSDLAASVGGGIGLAPSSSLGAGRPGLFEAIHGSAPDIAGTGRANPAATILSLAMLLRDLGEHAAAAAIERAVTTILDAGPVTPDLGGDATTQELGSAIARAVAQTPHEVLT